MGNKPKATSGSARCGSCAKPIRRGAKRCPHCRSPQGRPPLWRRPLAWITAATTLFSLTFAGKELYGAWSNSRQVAHAVDQCVATARTLAEARDFASAWKSLGDAQDADPTDDEITALQLEVAASWLRDVGAPSGWIPVVHGDEPASGATAGTVADTAYVPLVAAAVLAEGTTRANLEGLVAWAQFLRGRELLCRRRDIAEDLEKALRHDPNALYPNLFLGYWKVAMREDVAAAEEPWSRALASAPSEDLAYVRFMQLSALARLVERGDDNAGCRPARSLYLRTLDQMRRRRESPAHLVPLYTLLKLYTGSMWREDRCAEMSGVLPAADQLAIVDWVRGAQDLGDNEAGFHYIRGRLLEELGSVQEATQEFAAGRAALRGGGLAERLDAAWTRLTGEKVFRDDWAARADHLKHSPLDSPEVKEALDALAGFIHEEDRDIAWRFDTAMEALDAAIDRLSSELASARPGATIAGAPRATTESTLRTLRCYRGGIWMSGAFEKGTRELELLLSDPALSPELRRDALVELAEGYTYSPRAQRVDDVHSDSEWMVTAVYLSEGLDRLSAALDAGYADWNWVEERLKPLRALQSYAGLSLRHKRVPPRDDEEK